MDNQQYIIQKYVMASSVEEALKKSKRFPVHEVFVASGWFEKVANSTFFRKEVEGHLGFVELSPPKEKD